MSTPSRSLLSRPREAAGASGFAPLALGFRPFFLLAGVVGATFVPLWLFAFFGAIALPVRVVPMSWHAHEMLFGFAGAVIAGFLLTAARNWTSRPTPTGATLFVLVLLFALGRAALLCDALLPRGVAPVIDLAFLPAVALSIGIPIVRAKSWRNLGFVPLLLGMTGANALFHLSIADRSRAVRLALDLVLLMIVVMGGRVIPMFTANALSVETKKTPLLDVAALVALIVVAALELVPGAERALGASALLAGVVNLARMTGWRSFATKGKPILWVLHVGYAFVGLGLLLRGVSAFVPSWMPTAPLHVLAVGAIGTLTIGMMTRVALGHTGRMLAVPSAITIAYMGIGAAALLRGIGPLVLPASYARWLIASAVAWSISFSIFFVVYLPVLTRPRIDGKPG